MRFQTSRFGEIEVSDETVIQVHEGILGFPGERRYVLLEHDAEDTPFKWLQSVEDPNLAFVVIDPNEIVESYHFEIDDETVEELGSDDPDDYIPMVIVNIPREDPIKMTANLRGPIVVNGKNRHGRQIVLTDEAYPFDFRIFAAPDEEAQDAEAAMAESQVKAAV